MDDDGLFYPFLEGEGPRHRWGESEHPVLDDWPMPGQPVLRALPDPEPEVGAAADDAAPEAVADAPAKAPDTEWEEQKQAYIIANTNDKRTLDEFNPKRVIRLLLTALRGRDGPD